MLACLGFLLVAAAIGDVLQALFRPLPGGFISEAASRLVWRAFLAVRPSRALRALAGPAIVLGVIAGWILALILGWALVYRNAMPDGFIHMGTPASSPDGFGDALYMSVVTLSTLGYGDIVPVGPGIRMLAASEALIGFSMISACITWILSIYPALTRRRAFAYHLHLLTAAATRRDLHLAKLDEQVAGVLPDLMRELAAVHTDLRQFPHTYYFVENEARFELAAMLPTLEAIAHAGTGSDSPTLHFQGEMLLHALRDLACTLASHVGGDGERDLHEVLQRYAREHG